MAENDDNREFRSGRTRPTRVAERSVALFLLGLVCFTPPLLGIFGMQERVFGLPVLYVYLFTVWGALIALAAWIARRKDAGE